MSKIDKEQAVIDEAKSEHNHSSCQNGNGPDCFGDTVDRIACLEARGTEVDSDSADLSDNDHEVDSEAPEVFIDPKTYEITIVTKEQLRKMPKSQLIDYTVQMQICYTDLLHNYSLLTERTTKDNVLKYVSGSDKMKELIAVRNRQTGKSADTGRSTTQNAEENNVGNEQTGSARKSTPKRGPNQHKKWEQMPVYEEKADFTKAQKDELFREGYRYIRTENIDEIRVVHSYSYIYRRIAYVYQEMSTGKVIKSRYAKDIKFFPGSLLSADLLAYIANDYYNMSIPVDRQVKKFNSENCPLTPNEVYKWLRDFGKKYIRPVAKRMLELLLKRKNLQSDETYFKSIEEMLETGRKYCYYWLVRSSELDKENPPIAVIQFVRSRSAEELAKILGEDYDGMIECDGWGAYPALAKIMLKLQIACCLAHIRHYFSIAFKAVPGTRKMTEEERIEIPSFKLINEISKIFHEESFLKDYSREERLKVRNEKIYPMALKLFEHIEEYEHEPKHDPKSLFGKAVMYAINRKPYLLAGIQNPDLPIHNSACERNFISKSIFRNATKAFSSNENAAIAGDYFTVGTTCHENGGNTRMYYQFLFENVPDLMAKHAEDVEKQDYSFLDEYMPWSEKFKEYECCKAEEAQNFYANIQKSAQSSM